MNKNTMLVAIALAMSLAFASGCAATNKSSTTSKTNIQKEEKSKVDPKKQAEIDHQAETSVPAGTQVAVLETAKGRIVFRFFPGNAPNTVANFIKLAQSGFYDGTKFHRVEPNFVIQGGDPLSKDDDPSNDGTGDPGYKIKAEFNALKHLDGTVAMARSQDPDSAGSQFYICLGPQPFLDNQYTIFGQVIEGLDVVHNIAKYDVVTKAMIETR